MNKWLKDNYGEIISNAKITYNMLKEVVESWEKNSPNITITTASHFLEAITTNIKMPQDDAENVVMIGKVIQDNYIITLTLDDKANIHINPTITLYDVNDVKNNKPNADVADEFEDYTLSVNFETKTIQIQENN